MLCPVASQGRVDEDVRKECIQYKQAGLRGQTATLTTTIHVAEKHNPRMKFVTSDFLAAGGNRHPSAADWDCSSGVLAFGADRNIALWKPLDEQARGIYSLLSGHTESVNVVRFLEAGKQSILVSGSSDNSIRLWTRDDQAPAGFSQAKVILDHEKSVNAIAVLPGDAGIFVSGSSDAQLKVWKVEASSDERGVQVKLLQGLHLKPKFFPLALSLAVLSNSTSLILAAAGTKSLIQVYVCEGTESPGPFSLVGSLTGHEGWVRSLSFANEGQHSDKDLLLASTSQDKYVRLWRVHQGTELPAATEAVSDPALGSIGRSLSNKAHRFETGGSKYSVTFEALLLGHEDWIYTSQWTREGDKLKLLTASADNSLAIWELDPISGVWICMVRLGELSSQKGATTATGSTGGFYIGLWSPKGDAVVSLGRTGSWRVWTHEATEDTWTQGVGVSGHTKEVQGLAWSKDGSYLLSTSSDQTSRLYAEWKREGLQSWHEFSRPQIHGYDLNCIDAINESQFISGADEKLLRVFDEPKSVAESLRRLCGIQSVSNVELPDAANIPVLGLSNKAINVDNDDAAVDGEDHTENELPSETVSSSMQNHPPFEDHLSRHLLWPETEKLYGHGYEISAVAASNDGSLVATACRASSIDHAVIRLYDTKDWREVKPVLTAHSLTVTKLQFSPDDRHLLSVGRDRQCVVYERQEDRMQYKILASDPKAHTRMILDASWAPLEAGHAFATAGRDKNIHVWRVEGASTERAETISASLPVTAVAFHPCHTGDCVALAYGLEDGSVTVCKLSQSDLKVQGDRLALKLSITPSRLIMQLAWRPVGGNGDAKLAIASEDSSVRILDIDLASMSY